MQLKTLLAAIPVRQIIGTLDRPVESIAYDSRRVQKNGLFVAMRGEKVDGHDFMGQAVMKDLELLRNNGGTTLTHWPALTLTVAGRHVLLALVLEDLERAKKRGFKGA